MLALRTIICIVAFVKLQAYNRRLLIPVIRGNLFHRDIGQVQSRSYRLTSGVAFNLAATSGDEISSELEEVKRKLERAETRLEKALKDGNEKNIDFYRVMVIELQRKENILLNRQETPGASEQKRYFEQFFEFIRADTFTDAALDFTPFSSFPAKELENDSGSIKRVSVSLNEEPELVENKNVLEAYILPNNMSWPMFSGTKQFEASATSIYFHRISRTDERRNEETLLRLRNLRRTAWIGSPGIGKTSGLNYILMELLRHLGEEGWPPVVALRQGSILTTFSLGSGKKVEVLIEEVDFMKDIRAASSKIRDRKGVMLVELEENEKDLTIYCGALVSMSNRLGVSDFNDLKKGGLIWLLVNTWNEPELKAAALCILSSDGKVCEAETMKDTLSLVEERFINVGGLPRILFSSEKYGIYLGELNKKKSAALYKEIEESDIFSVSDTAKFFITPAVLDIEKLPTSDNFRWAFLSAKQAIVLAQSKDYPEFLESLKALSMFTALHEEVVKFAINNNPTLVPLLRFTNWDFYPDNGMIGRIMKKLPKGLGIRKFTRRFNGGFCSGDASRFDEDTQYISDGQKMVLADSFVVSHEYKRVFLISSSLSVPEKHPFKVENLASWIRELQLDKNGYELVIVYVMSKEKAVPRKGIKFTRVINGVTKTYDINEVKKVLTYKNISSYLVRTDTLFSVQQENREARKLSDSDTVWLIKPNAKNFHIFKNCHYLKTKATAITYEEAKNRNISKCSACKKRYSNEEIISTE